MSKAKRDRTAVALSSHYPTKANWLREILSGGQLPLVVWLQPDRPEIAVIGRSFQPARDLSAWQYMQAHSAALVRFLTRLGLVGIDPPGRMVMGLWFGRDGMTHCLVGVRHV